MFDTLGLGTDRVSQSVRGGALCVRYTGTGYRQGVPVSEGGGHCVFDTLGLGTGRVPKSVRGGGHFVFDTLGLRTGRVPQSVGGGGGHYVSYTGTGYRQGAPVSEGEGVTMCLIHWDWVQAGCPSQ